MWQVLPCPLQHPAPNLGAVVRPLHGFFVVGQRGLVVVVNPKPPRGVPYPQLGAPRILFGMPLERQDGAVVAEEGLVVGEECCEAFWRGADCAAVVLLQGEAAAAACWSGEETAAGGC